MRIILVDDEPGALKVLTESVKECINSDTITTFSNPIKAYEYSKENIVDIAFIDISMEKMSGIELAKRLKASNKNINIVFTTGHEEYMADAIELHVSSYILKPVTGAKVTKALKNLLYPIEKKNYRIYAKTFGTFDFLVDGKSVYFKRKKAKEVLAYLIDRGGSIVTKKELGAIIFEDLPYNASNQSYLSKILKELQDALEEANVEDILIKRFSEYSIDTSKIYCDSYEYLKGNVNEINNFHGEYMTQYSWAEYSLSKFEKNM